MKRYIIFLTVILTGLYFGCTISDIGNGNTLNNSQVTNSSESSSKSSSESSDTSTTSVSSVSSVAPLAPVSSSSSSIAPIVEINYDNGALEAGVLNDNYPAPYEAAVYFSPAKLSEYIGKSIVTIKFYYACESTSGASIGVYLYSVKNNKQQGDIVFSKSLQQYSIVPGWNTVQITPYVIPSEGIWVVIYMAQWTSSECIVMDSGTSIFQDGINVNQLNGVPTDTIGKNHNFLIRIKVQ